MWGLPKFEDLFDLRIPDNKDHNGGFGLQKEVVLERKSARTERIRTKSELNGLITTQERNNAFRV